MTAKNVIVSAWHCKPMMCGRWTPAACPLCILEDRLDSCRSPPCAHIIDEVMAFTALHMAVAVGNVI